MGWKIISIFLLTMLKFIAGPVGGYAAGLHFLITVGITVGGMMSSVVLFTFLGGALKRNLIDRIYRRRKRFTKRNRRFVQIWKKFGLRGVAFLTPIIFTPIGGTLLMTSMGTTPRRIIFSMLLSAVFWSFVFSFLIYTFGQTLIPEAIRPASLHLEVFLSAE